jgi:aspartate aminotransferase
MSTSTTTSVQPHLSSRILEMEESSTLAMSRMARELAAEGHDVISLSLGEPDFDTPDHIKEAAKLALDQGHTKYTPVNGTPALREAIVRKFKRDNGLTFTPEQIVVSNGAKQSIANLCMSLLDPGDEAIVLAPDWVSYFAQIKLAGGVAVALRAGVDDDYKVAPERLAAAITGKTRFVLFSSPGNPTGSVYNRAELQAIADVLAKHPNIVVISDEIYEYIQYGREHVSIASLPGMQDRTVTVNGFAKGFAMTGWRLGYIGAPLWLAKACTKFQGQITSGANAFAQQAAITALDADMSPTYKMREAFQKRRDLVIKELETIPGFRCNVPEGAFYVFPDVSALFGKTDGTTTINTANDLSIYLLQKAHVATVSGSGFGNDDCIRLSFAASEEKLMEAMRRVREVVGELG